MSLLSLIISACVTSAVVYQEVTKISNNNLIIEIGTLNSKVENLQSKYEIINKELTNTINDLYLYEEKLVNLKLDSKNYARKASVEPILDINTRVDDLVNHITTIKNSMEVVIKNELSSAKKSLHDDFNDSEAKSRAWVTEQLDKRVNQVVQYLSNVATEVKVNSEQLERDVILIKSKIEMKETLNSK